MEKINKLTLPIAIITASLILGGFFYAIQVNKQKSIEKQQQIKLQDDRRAEEVKAEQDKADNYFKKKIECEKNVGSIKKEVDEYNNSWGKFNIYSHIFQMLFYSPKDNSCLYVILKAGEKQEYFIYNALTKSKITSFRFPVQWEDYKKFILEYSNGEIRL